MPENACGVCLPRSSPVKRNANPERKTVACFYIIRRQEYHRRPSQDTQTHSNSVPENADNVCLPRSSPVQRNVNPERKTLACFHISYTTDALVKIHKLTKLYCKKTLVALACPAVAP